MERRVGSVGATAIGVGSMLGAGAFVVWGPAYEAAGDALAWAVLLAGAVAALNAGSTAQLAAAHPVAGGAYAYGRAELSPWAGYVAGIGFVVGKTASIAAVALALGAALAPGAQAWIATAAIVASWAVNSLGVTRTSTASVVLAASVIGVLVAVVIALAGAERASDAWFGWSTPLSTVTGIAHAAALVFFAFAGYARVATLGEEVRDPARTIPRAIAAALAIVLAAYLALAVALPAVLGSSLATATTPVADAVAETWLPAPLVTVATVAAAAGSLLALTAGVGRTAMAMARERDLPPSLASLDRHGVPARAEGAACAVAIALAWTGDLTFAIAMSSCAVLLYYAVANAAAFRAAGAGRVAGPRMPRALSALGTVACLALVAALPAAAVLASGAVLAALVVARAAVTRARR